jgi:hypothetical protein
MYGFSKAGHTMHFFRKVTVEEIYLAILHTVQLSFLARIGMIVMCGFSKATVEIYLAIQ